MHALPIVVAATVVLAPLVASAALPTAPTLPEDLTDAALLRILAERSGLQLREHTLTVPPDASVESVAIRLADRAGTTLTDAERAELRRLDVRIAAPTLLVLLAVERAWDLRDEAYAPLAPGDRARLLSLPPDDPEAQHLAAGVDPRPVYEAAILLLDTLEGRALPALREASQVVPWPATPLVDNPVLRLGGTGNDAIGSDRILQIDPAGNDLYRNNAGASTLLDPANTLIETPIGILIDFAGDDAYTRLEATGGYRPYAQGSGMHGIGYLLDYEGNDAYDAGGHSQGAAGDGVGILRDLAGDDTYSAGSRAAGYSNGGPGVLRDSGGNDRYVVAPESGGASTAPRNGRSYGILWDETGQDRYETKTLENEAYGWTTISGNGWLIDEGVHIDYYQTAFNDNFYRHGCNNCEWRAGFTTPSLGRGVDYLEGLEYLLATTE